MKKRLVEWILQNTWQETLRMLLFVPSLPLYLIRMSKISNHHQICCFGDFFFVFATGCHRTTLNARVFLVRGMSNKVKFLPTIPERVVLGYLGFIMFNSCKYKFGAFGLLRFWGKLMVFWEKHYHRVNRVLCHRNTLLIIISFLSTREPINASKELGRDSFYHRLSTLGNISYDSHPFSSSKTHVDLYK